MARIYKRVRLNHPAIVAINPAEPCEMIFLVRAVDISASGALFRSQACPFPGAPVKIMFILRQGNSQMSNLKVTFTGRVNRCEPEKFAVAFDEIRPIILSPEGLTFNTAK